MRRLKEVLFYNNGEFSTKKMWFNSYAASLFIIFWLDGLGLLMISAAKLSIWAGFVTGAAAWYVAGKRLDGHSKIEREQHYNQ